MAGGTHWQLQRYLRHLPMLIVFALVSIALLAQQYVFDVSTAALDQNATAVHEEKFEGQVYGALQTQVIVATHPLQDWKEGHYHDRARLAIDHDGTPDGLAQEPELVRRIPPIPFLDSTWKQAKKKGEKLLCALKDPSHAGNAATSPWNKIEQLTEWGWEREVVDGDDEKDYSHVVRACPGLQSLIGTDLTGGKQRKWVHENTVEVEGVTYFATRGVYINVYWPEQGIIMANDNYSPAYQAEQGHGVKVPFKDASGNPLPLPQLKQWSDVNAITYTSLSNPQPLRFIFRRNIQNGATKDLISRVLKKNKMDDHGLAPLWPGVVLTPADKGFTALVASPNMGGVCWLLIQHGNALGARGIQNVRVWRDTMGQYTPSLLVEVGAV